jgi:hypothetical protein
MVFFLSLVATMSCDLSRSHYPTGLDNDCSRPTNRRCEWSITHLLSMLYGLPSPLVRRPFIISARQIIDSRERPIASEQAASQASCIASIVWQH